LIDGMFGTNWADGKQRIISFQRSPVFVTIDERIPQTLWVAGMSYIVGVLIALPIKYIRQTVFGVPIRSAAIYPMVGFQPPFFWVFCYRDLSVLGYCPSVYDTTHVVNSWDSFIFQMKQR
jgi:peptide/nickel transport system permease protein